MIVFREPSPVNGTFQITPVMCGGGERLKFGMPIGRYNGQVPAHTLNFQSAVSTDNMQPASYR